PCCRLSFGKAPTGGRWRASPGFSGATAAPTTTTSPCCAAGCRAKTRCPAAAPATRGSLPSAPSARGWRGMTPWTTRSGAAPWAAGVLALAVALGLLCAVPYFTVPRLQHVFQGLPSDYHGTLTRGLYALAEAVRRWLAFWVVLLAGGAGLFAWALPGWCGPWRSRLDRRFPWRLYRDFHAIRFLAMLAVLVRQRGNVDTRLRQALAAQAWHARAWLAWHIDEMLARVDRGLVGAETFDTGLFDRETAWFMADMI